MSPFATVKTSKYGAYRARESRELWSEDTWRSIVLIALLDVIDTSLRITIARLCSFRYTVNQLQVRIKE